jgi:site-specific DNA recombinase
VLYARVSTDEQARNGFSLAQQLEMLRAYALGAGLRVVEEVVDAGESGATLVRPGLDRVRDLARGGGVSVVLAQDRDRLSREPAHLYLLGHELEAKGCRLGALNDREDSSPEGELSRGVMDLVAKYERTKMAERSRRGKMRRAREGKVVPTGRARYGFRYDDARENLLVFEPEMRVVRLIFRMIGRDGRTIYATKRALERASIPSPGGKRNWAQSFIRGCVLEDAYKPHRFREIAELVSPEVAGGLGRGKTYGVWWSNRAGFIQERVVEEGPDGVPRYRLRSKRFLKPPSEWIAVPIPGSGTPRSWVDAARERVSRNGPAPRPGSPRRELVGILRCAVCNRTMKFHRVGSGHGDSVNLYYRCSKVDVDVDGCTNGRSLRAEEAERAARRFALGLLSGSSAAEGMHVEPPAEAGAERREALRRAWREAYEKIGLGARAFPEGRMELSGTPPSSTRSRQVVAVPRDEYARARIGD